jgi:hypothetical protein
MPQASTISVEPASGRTVIFDPAKYNHLDWGWASTTFKGSRRRRSDRLRVDSPADTAGSAHVALTRCQTGTSPRALQPTLYAKIEAETGWTEYLMGAVNAACAGQRERPAASAIRCFFERRWSRAQPGGAAIHAPYAARIGLWPTQRSRRAARREREDPVWAVLDRYAPLSFVDWGQRIARPSSVTPRRRRQSPGSEA